jgi:hypothetical protein
VVDKLPQVSLDKRMPDLARQRVSPAPCLP